MFNISRKFSESVSFSLPDHATYVLLGEGVGILLTLDTVGVVGEGRMFVLPVFLLKNSIIFLFLLFRLFPCRLVFVVGKGGCVNASEGLGCEGGGGVLSELVLSGGRADLSMQFIE